MFASFVCEPGPSISGYPGQSELLPSIGALTAARVGDECARGVHVVMPTMVQMYACSLSSAALPSRTCHYQSLKQAHVACHYDYVSYVSLTSIKPCLVDTSINMPMHHTLGCCHNVAVGFEAKCITEAKPNS